jgi:hypothetical protein
MTYEELKNKNILILCPHQDDEINMAAGLIPVLIKNRSKVNVVYSTNGDFFVNMKYRYKEAKKSLKVLGVPQENIYFLGYPDCLTSCENHLYMTNDNWISKNGLIETSSFMGMEYHMKKHNTHAALNKMNFVNDIKDIILDTHPDIIICVDFDSHADHRALSLSFETAMGIILNEKDDYSPKVLKSFAYPTSYNGAMDFKNAELLRTTFLTEKNNKFSMQNPYYDWNKRIIIDILPCSKNRFLLLNKTFRALTKHHSQFIITKTYSIINSDQVYFERKTNNLLRKANIITSTGDAKYLNDFLLFDCSDIMHGDSKSPKFDLGCTKFEETDKYKTISINFAEEKNVETIKIYQKAEENVLINKISIINKNKKNTYELNKNNCCYELRNLKYKNVKNLTIILEGLENTEINLTEIEIFENDSKDMLNTEIILNKKIKRVSFHQKVLFMMDDVIIFAFRVLNKLIRVARKYIDK